MKQKYYPRFEIGDLVMVLENVHNSEKTKKYAGMVGVVRDKSCAPFVEIGNESIVFADDELRLFKVKGK